MSEKIPDGWVKSELGQLISEIGDGGTPSTSDPQNFGGGIPWVVIDDICPKIYKTQTTISEQGLQKSSAKLWGKETVILSTGATIGRVGIAKTRLTTKQGICGIITTNKLDSTYLYQYLLSITAKLNALSQGSTIKETRPPIIKKIRFNLPPLPEQRKIATILTSVDEIIENTRKQIEKLQDLKKAVMNDLLTKGIGHTEFKDSELGRIPKNWEVKKLEEVGQIIGGGTPSSQNESYWGGEIQWVTPAEITKLNGRYIEKTERTLTKKGLEESSAKLHPKGTIFLTTRASIGFPAINTVPMATNQGFQSLRPNKKLDAEFGYQMLLTSREKLERLSAGSTFLEISSKEVKKFKLSLPPLPEQKKIASILTSMDENIEEKQRKLHKTESLKKSLMQDLLTGRVRVKVN